jgi:hypothetical protein
MSPEVLAPFPAQNPCIAAKGVHPIFTVAYSYIIEYNVLKS